MRISTKMNSRGHRASVVGGRERVEASDYGSRVTGRRPFVVEAPGAGGQRHDGVRGRPAVAARHGAVDVVGHWRQRRRPFL